MFVQLTYSPVGDVLLVTCDTPPLPKSLRIICKPSFIPFVHNFRMKKALTYIARELRLGLQDGICNHVEVGLSLAKNEAWLRMIRILFGDYLVTVEYREIDDEYSSNE